MKQHAKSKETDKINISENKKQEFLDKIKKFEYLRHERVSRYQGIYLALLVAVILVFVDIVAGKDITLKIGLIIILIILAEIIYRKSLTQTQKQVFVCENVAGTIEKGPHYVKAKDGKEYAIFGVSDFIIKNGKKEK